MPQTRGNINWTTNNRIQIQDPKIRTGNLRRLISNRSQVNVSQKTAESILDEKYRSYAELDYDIKEARKEASKVFYQSKVLNEVSGQWDQVINERKSVRDNDFANKVRKRKQSLKANPRIKSANNEASPGNSMNMDSNTSIRKSHSAYISKERTKVIEKPNNYSRSYRYLRSLVEIDNLSRERFQLYYESKLQDTKLRQEKSDLVLRGKLKSFYEEIDKFTNRADQIKMTELRYNDKRFLASLIMPDFEILLH